MSEVVDAEVVEDDEVKSLAPRSNSLAMQDEWTVDQLMEQMAKIERAMKEAMKPDVHYGIIKGTKKPTLLKPGAEKLCVMFRLGPKYRTDKTFHENGHLTVTAICSLSHIPTGNFVAEGEGMCSTLEKKYRWRDQRRACPECGNTETLNKSKKDDGYYCWAKIGGCGATFGDNDQRITNQKLGKTENPDVADSYNTVLKMACKRALIAACLNGTAASDIFTQDLESPDVEERSGGSTPNAALPGSDPQPEASQTASRSDSSQPWFTDAVRQHGAARVKTVASVANLSELVNASEEQRSAILRELNASDWAGAK